MAIDWNGPLEAVHASGKVQPVELDRACAQPDSGGYYGIVDTLDCGIGFGPEVFRADGTTWIDDGQEWSAWTIRNRG